LPAEVKLREDYSAEELRALARRLKDARQSRRLLSLAAVRDGIAVWLVRLSRLVGGPTWSATDETVEIFVEADTNELPEERRRFALIQHPSPPVQPSNRRGHETKERKASIAEKSAQPSTLP
jgi:hypothetical protein